MTENNDNEYYGHVKIPLKRVHVELTNVCGFNCTFCPKQHMERPNGFMDTGLAKEIITELGKNKICEKVTFHVMGEPTLHPDFFEILEHAQNENVNIGLTTNGGTLGKSVGERLLDFDLYQVDVSLQTPDAESFDLRKAGKLTFDNYLKGILNFYESYHARKNRDTIFKFRFLNTRFRLKEMEEKVGPIRVMSSARELHDTFRYWAGKIYEINNVDEKDRIHAFKKIDKLKSFKWNVVEIYPNLFFETYILEDWGNAFTDKKIMDAWAGYCFGMRDHFSVLYNGDVTLCCIDYNGKTGVGNLNDHSLKEILSSEELREIIDGFKRYKVVHPYCKYCLGSKSILSWMTKPILAVTALKALKPIFYKQIKLFR